MTSPRCALLVCSAVLAALLAVPTVADAAAPRVTVRLATAKPTAGKAFAVTGTAPGNVRRTVRLQMRVTRGWTTLAHVRTGSHGGFRLTTKLANAGVKRLRVLAPAVRHHRAALSRTITVTLRAAPPVVPPAPPTVPTNGCTPGTAATDPAADQAAADLVTELGDWRTSQLMAVGQQVNISSDSWEEPLTELDPHETGVIGFDLDELRQAQARGKDPLATLITRAQQQGSVLTATWHARNPWTGGSAFDRTSASHLADLLDPTTAAGTAFWSAWDSEVAAPLARIRDAGLPVILRPLHEAGGDWFWWGSPDPVVYKKLWVMMQQRAADAGLQNVLWSYAGALRNRAGIADPLTLLPGCVELGGLDTYDPENGDPTDRVNLTDYARLAAKVPFMALSEVGPQGSDGSWNPSVITSTLKAQKLYASYASFWFDDSDGKKQLASLSGGVSWLAACETGSGLLGFCRLT